MADYSKSNKRSQADIHRKEIADNTAETKEQTKLFNKKLGDITKDNIADIGVTLATQVYKTGKEALEATQAGLLQEGEAVNQNVQQLREMYGGMGKDIDFNYMANNAASEGLKRYMVLSNAYSEATEEAMNGAVKKGSEILNNISGRGNILEELIGDPKTAFENVDNILADLSTTFGNEIAKLEDEQIVKLAFYEEALGTSASTLQNIFQKQIGFTGEISTDVLDKLGAYAANLSMELNIPMKTLTGMTTEMMSNTQMFGDITVEEATRMSAKLSQLGVTMEQLNAQTNKFGSFQGAAQAAGTIAQLTGAQVDAMKMSFLASEGKFDELIEYQRDSLLKAGFTKEKFLNQSNSMRNAIADSFGRSQEEMAILLDRNRKITSQEELEAIMKEGEVAEEDGFERLLNNIDQTKLALDDIEERAKRIQVKSQMAATESLVPAMEAQHKINKAQINAMEVLTSDINTKRIETVTQTITGLYNSMTNIITGEDAQKFLETIGTLASQEGAYANRLKQEQQQIAAMQKESDQQNGAGTSETTQERSRASGIVTSTAGGGYQANSPTLNQTFQVTVQRDGETYIKTMIYDEAGKLIKESEEKIQAVLETKAEKSNE